MQYRSNYQNMSLMKTKKYILLQISTYCDENLQAKKKTHTDVDNHNNNHSELDNTATCDT